MVVAVQCPNAACKKFQLVEDHQRGKVVPCLLCKTNIRIGRPGDSSPKLPAQPKPPATPG